MYSRHVSPEGEYRRIIVAVSRAKNYLCVCVNNVVFFYYKMLGSRFIFTVIVRRMLSFVAIFLRVARSRKHVSAAGRGTSGRSPDTFSIERNLRKRRANSVLTGRSPRGRREHESHYLLIDKCPTNRYPPTAPPPLEIKLRFVCNN